MKEHNKYHEPQILFQSCHGYIVRCRDCKLFQVAFGNIALDISFTEFKNLTAFISSERERYKSKKYSKRAIYINSPDRSVRFILTSEELENFNKMLQQTCLLVLPDCQN